MSEPEHYSASIGALITQIAACSERQNDSGTLNNMMNDLRLAAESLVTDFHALYVLSETVDGGLQGRVIDILSEALSVIPEEANP